MRVERTGCHDSFQIHRTSLSIEGFLHKWKSVKPVGGGGAKLLLPKGDKNTFPVFPVTVEVKHQMFRFFSLPRVSEEGKCKTIARVCVTVLSRVGCRFLFFVAFALLLSSSSGHPSLRHTLSSQKKKKMATNRKRESCQVLLPLLRLPLPCWSPVYWSGGVEGKGILCQIIKLFASLSGVDQTASGIVQL